MIELGFRSPFSRHYAHASAALGLKRRAESVTHHDDALHLQVFVTNSNIYFLMNGAWVDRSCTWSTGLLNAWPLLLVAIWHRGHPFSARNFDYYLKKKITPWPKFS